MLDLKFQKKAVSLRKNIKKRTQQHLMRIQNITNNASLSSLIVNGGIPLNGTISISGAKNSALPLLFATILSNKPLSINNIPNLSDINVTLSILKELGAKININSSNVNIDPTTINKYNASDHLVSSMRASVLMLGPLTTKFGIAEITLPGGCTIGKRPIDLHLNYLRLMGAEIITLTNKIYIKAQNGLKGTTINIEKASVGATENVIMAAVLAKGTTKILNPAQEPEIIDLIRMLQSMGAKIIIHSTNLIEIEGVKELTSTNYTVCPDRIEAGSYLIAVAATRGNATLENVNYKDLKNIIEPLKYIGCKITSLENNKLHISSSNILTAKSITTAPYPGFATDLQPQWTALMCTVKGSAVINEAIFENRLGHAKELIKMGADIEIINPQHSFKVNGVNELKGATVFPQDLRSSFALIIAALVAKGITTIYNLSFLDRGYEDAIMKLKQCGANITRINSLDHIDNPKLKILHNNQS